MEPVSPWPGWSEALWQTVVAELEEQGCSRRSGRRCGFGTRRGAGSVVGQLLRAPVGELVWQKG